MSYYLEPYIHIGNRVRVLSDLSIYACKKIKISSGVRTSNVAAKSKLNALKADVDKMDINKLVNVLSSFKNVKM